jgi:hypothetical protein
MRKGLVANVQIVNTSSNLLPLRLFPKSHISWIREAPQLDSVQFAGLVYNI